MASRTEIWKDIPGYEGFYEASNLGRIKSVQRIVFCGTRGKNVRERIRKSRINRYGYSQLQLNMIGKKKTFTVHKLIAITFLENTNHHPDINHKNGDKQDNTLENLEWCSTMENCCHRSSLSSKSSMYVGVHWDKKDKKWKSYITLENKQIYLGSFNDEKSAYDKRVLVEKENNILNKYI